jgi:hypothetical protein
VVELIVLLRARERALQFVGRRLCRSAERVEISDDLLEQLQELVAIQPAKLLGGESPRLPLP